MNVASKYAIYLFDLFDEKRFRSSAKPFFGVENVKF